MQPIQVEVHTTDLAKKHGDDQQNNKYPDMLIVCQWSDVLTDVDYTQDSPFWCGLPSSKMNVSDKILNPNIAHDIKIWEQHVQKENDIGDIVPWVYTDEEERERETIINYLKNCSASMEFTKVVSKATEKKRQKGF